VRVARITGWTTEPGARGCRRREETTMQDTRKCPYCAEEIAAAAIRCRFCRSRLSAIDPEAWHRDHPGRRVAGVAVAVARALAMPVGAVRACFVLATFVHLLGPVVYAALWLTIPYRDGGDALLDRLLAEVRAIVTRLWTDGPHAASPDAPSRQGPMS
jgi:phage shock protein PspC (stress-responsive transcriptional regulator)